jgi:outer membrane receptor for ferric coprogen and ferric-rhodotorulic acid
MPLFVNDSLDGKNFQVVYENKLDEFTLHGELSYLEGEDFNVTAALTLNNFKTSSQYKAWGLLPVEFTTTLRWQILKDLWLKADLWAFQGAYWRYLNKSVGTGDGGFDVNAGMEFRLTKQFNLWLQMNNLFNDKYQRWNQYSVYGFNILGGVIFTFGK